ncbi:unnamed protein product [Caenorhabditis sp. 36 PRJEB53466]|nr:unnamed protein product [Caenorhabditis sp. 36 PRJEB53466]
MMRPADAMHSFISHSWLADEIEGSVRELAGADSSQATVDPAKEQDPEEPKNTDVTPLEAFNAVQLEGEPLLTDMHAAVMISPTTFDKSANNMEMNRIPHIYCYDHTRVVLSEEHGKGDYYHASFVDGYNKKSAYIFAQAPFDDVTERAFWRMVVDQKPSMILVFGKIDEKQKCKAPYNVADKAFEKAFLQEFGAKTFLECELKAKLCRQFWAEKDGKKTFGEIKISTTCENSETHMKTFNLNVKDGKSEAGDGSSTVLMHFHEWGDKQDDELPEYMLDMRASIKVQYIRNSKKPGTFAGPIMLVCATGVAKCAIYATIDIIVSRMTEEHTVGFKETMTAIKQQRYGCFRTTGPYTTAREMLMKFAVSTGVVHDTAIGDKPKTVKSKVNNELSAKKAKGGFTRDKNRKK